jgi:hypothetical protein
MQCGRGLLFVKQRVIQKEWIETGPWVHAANRPSDHSSGPSLEEIDRTGRRQSNMPRKPVKTKTRKARRSSVKTAASGQNAKKRWDETAVIRQNIYSGQEVVE